MQQRTLEYTGILAYNRSSVESSPQGIDGLISALANLCEEIEKVALSSPLKRLVLRQEEKYYQDEKRKEEETCQVQQA